MSLRPDAAIYGCAGARLNDEERRFLADADPLGIILFARNCETPAQIRALIADISDCLGRRPLVLIDQEGGRVARLRPPHWPVLPAVAWIGDLWQRDRAAAERAAFLHGRLLAAMLAPLGITVDCAPVLDIAFSETHDVIGDRAFSPDAEAVAILGRALTAGLLAGGVLPVIKHVPGHGRARADSHKELPRVDASAGEMAGSDWHPFRALADAPLAMTAHILYTALDPVHPATLSKTVIEDIIRGRLGVSGLLMSDDIGMKALSGSPGTLTRAAIDAGCDCVLHCSGRLDEMIAVAGAAGKLNDAAMARLRRAESMLRLPQPADEMALREEYDTLQASLQQRL